MTRTALRSLLAVAILATAGLSLRAWILAPHAWQPAGMVAIGVLGPLTLLTIALLIPAALRFLLRPKRVLRDALLVLNAAATLLAFAAGSTGLTVAAVLLGLGTLAAGGLWPGLSDRPSLRAGWALLAAAGTALLGLFLLDRPSGLMITLVSIVFLLALAAAAWGVLLLLRNAPLPADSRTHDVATVYSAHAAAGVSAYALMQDKKIFQSRDGRAFLAYGARLDTAIVLGPGIGPRESVESLYRQFREECHLRGWRLAFYQVPGGLVDTLGWGMKYRVGSEAMVNLKTLTLDGPAMAKLRHEVSRGRRNNVTIRLVQAGDLTPADRAAMRALANTWMSRHALGEMGFSVGRGEHPTLGVTIGLAEVASNLVAYATWICLPGTAGVVLDEVRRIPQAPGGAMDLLLYESMQSLRKTASWASLGLAPAATPLPSAKHASHAAGPITRAQMATAVARLGDHLGRRLGLISVSTSLFSFKSKFQPTWEPRYMVAERLTDWAPVALATLLLHYPKLERRLLPISITPRRQAQAAAGLTFALLAAGMSGILAAAAQSHEGHPLYGARVAAIQFTSAVLPATGRGNNRHQYPYRAVLHHHGFYAHPIVGQRITDGLRKRAVVGVRIVGADHDRARVTLFADRQPAGGGIRRTGPGRRPASAPRR